MANDYIGRHDIRRPDVEKPVGLLAAAMEQVIKDGIERISTKLL